VVRELSTGRELGDAKNESHPAHPRLGCAGPLFVLTFWSAPRDRLRCRAGPRRTVLPTPWVQRKHRIERLGPPLRGTAWWRVQLYGEARLGGFVRVDKQPKLVPRTKER